MSLRVAVLVSGEGSNLQALIDAELPIAAVASNKPSVPALGRAASAGIPARVFPLEAYASRERRDTEMAAWLTLRGVDLVVSAGFMHLLTPPFLERFPERIVNVHPSLLPAFPGARAIDPPAAEVAPRPPKPVTASGPRYRPARGVATPRRSGDYNDGP